MWHRAMAVSDLLQGCGKALEIAGRSVAFFNVDGKVYAIENHCLHRGGPLGDGHLEGSQVTCPWHAWQFDVKTGKCHTMKGAKQKKYAIKIKNEDVWVNLESKDN